METGIHENYPSILEDVNSGMSVNKSIQKLAISRSSFFKWRWIAEMKIIDEPNYQHLRHQFSSNSKKLSDECKEAVTDEGSPFYAAAEQKRAAKQLLPYSK